MSSGNEPQGPNNDEPNQEVQFPRLNLTLINTPEFINLIAPSIHQEMLTSLQLLEVTPIGVAMSLACNARTGGKTLYVETTIVEQGEGIVKSCQFMGAISYVMKRSAEIAYLVAQYIVLEIEPENHFFSNSKLRLRFLGGSEPRDGACTGCSILTSFLSLSLNKPVTKKLAMTGEITLTGQILRISDVRKKILAAKRCHVTMIIFPEANRGEFDMLEANVKQGFEVRFVDSYKQVFELAFGYQVVLSTLEDIIFEETPVGVAMSLAYSRLEVGAATYIETTVVEVGEGISGGEVIGHMDSEMKHSAQIAYNVAARILSERQPGNRFFWNCKVHLKFLGRAIYRDGASAGCTMVTSFLSRAMNRPVRRHLAMTGGVHLTGGVFGIGAVREKTIAAKRFQVTMIIFPEANREEFEGLEDSVTEGLNARFVDNYNQVFELAFNYD